MKFDKRIESWTKEEVEILEKNNLVPRKTIYFCDEISEFEFRTCFKNSDNSYLLIWTKDDITIEYKVYSLEKLCSFLNFEEFKQFIIIKEKQNDI